MKKGNLLLVDDEPMILTSLKFNFEEFADNIYTAENGMEALELLNKYEIHCVICDINMPGMTGVEVIKKIRESGNNVPFVFYTAHGSNELMMEAVKYGAFDFLSKPSLDGIEDVITRGLKEGFQRNSSREKSEDSYISEYQKLLDRIEKKDESV